MKSNCLLVLLITLSISARAQQGDSVMIRQIANEVLEHGRAYDNLRVLCKNVGGRLAGSPQMVRAETWGRECLQQAGADIVYQQECMVPHWVRGGKDIAYFKTGSSNKNFPLDVLALGGSPGTGKKGLNAPLIMVKDFDELEQRKAEIKGKIVFYNYPFNPRFIRTFEAYGDAVKYRVTGPARAAAYGALAVLVRSMSHATDNYPHTGGTHYAADGPAIPALAIGLQDADRLAAAINKNERVSVYLQNNAKTLPDTIGHNIIGEWKGTEFPGSVITVGGHLDSWDVGEGAHDDGAGCVQAIEVLRVLKQLGYRPRHTIRVVLFANEENGTRGGLQYAEEMKKQGLHALFALESDAGGFTPRGFSFTAPDSVQLKLKRYASLLAPYGAGDFMEGGGGADIRPLRDQGTVLAGFIPDSQRYFDYHHSRHDVFENVNKRELELGAINMAAMIYLVDKYGL